VALLAVIALSLILVPILLEAPELARRLTHPLEYKAEIQASAAEFDVEPALVAAVVRAESRFDPTAESSRGAHGLMQLRPETVDFISTRGGPSGDYRDPETNIRMGTWYLRYLRGRYDGDLRLVLAAYNSGPSRVDVWTSRQGFDIARDIPFAETRDYVTNVQESRRIYTELYGANLDENEA
jgi:soluble lytic murein transglycosylase